MNKKNIALSAFLIIFLLIIFCPLISSAQTSIIDPSDASKYTGGNYTLNDILTIAIKASKYILGIVGSLTLLMFIYGGFTFLISAGSSDKIGDARKIITAAAVGLIIVFSSYLIIRFVLNSLGLGWNGEAVTQASNSTVEKAQCKDYFKTYSCVDKTGRTGCIANYCPGQEDNIQCCPPLK
ncbi:MAG: pilin [Patescibacteria group bacterium]